MSNQKKVINYILFVVMISIAIGSIVFAVILRTESVWLSIGVYLFGQIIAGLPLDILVISGIRQTKKERIENQKKTDGILHDELFKVATDVINDEATDTDIAPDYSVVTGIADDWWDNPPADTEKYHFEIGFGKEESLSDSKKTARTNANIALAHYFRNTKDNLFKLAGKTISTFDTINVFRDVLPKVRFISREMEDKSVYVLAALPLDLVVEKINSVAEAKIKMNETIDKYFN